MEFTGNTKFALPRFQKVRAFVFTLQREEKRPSIRLKEREREGKKEKEFYLADRVAIDIERNVGHGTTCCIPWMVEFA